VVIEGDKVVLQFEGKGGKPVKREIRDRLLARVAKRLSTLKGRRLFSAPDGTGRQRPVTAREVNTFLAEASGTDVTAKDFRTFRASAEALAFLAEHNGHEIEKLRKQAIVEAADKASEILVNTRGVARSSYIHPSVIKAYQSGLGAPLIESALMRFLERKPV
jgi:DNA topoisomerase I